MGNFLNKITSGLTQSTSEFPQIIPEMQNSAFNFLALATIKAKFKVLQNCVNLLTIYIFIGQIVSNEPFLKTLSQ